MLHLLSTQDYIFVNLHVRFEVYIILLISIEYSDCPKNLSLKPLQIFHPSLRHSNRPTGAICVINSRISMSN